MFFKESNFTEDILIGKLPKEWHAAALNDLGLLQYGITTSATKDNTGIKLLRITDIKENGVIDWQKAPYCKIDVVKSEKYQLMKGDVLFARIGATTGKTCYIEKAIKSVFGSYLIRFQFHKEEEIDPLFVYYFTQSGVYWHQINKVKEGQLKKGLNTQLLYALKLPKPPLSEQKGIVDVLSCVDLAIQKSHEVIVKTERLKKGLMQKLLTEGIGHKEFKDTEIGKIPKEWEVDILPNLLNVIDYRGRTPPFSESGIPYLGSDNIRNERIVLDSRRYVSEETYERYMTRGIPRPADILFTTEAPLGETAIIPKGFKFCFAQRLVAFQCKDKLNPFFIMYMLRSKIVQKQLESWATGTTAKGISAKNMRFIKIPYSTEETEQQKIADILLIVDRKLELERKERASLERVKQSLMDLLLAGKIRVKVD